MLFYCETDRALAQVFQWGGRASILGDIQELSRHGPGQPAVGGPAWASVDDDLQKSLATTVSLWLSELKSEGSVITEKLLSKMPHKLH